MGWHMAAHLSRQEYPVWVWNRTQQKSDQHAKCFGTIAVSIQQAVQADYIFSCLPTSADIEALIMQFPPKPGSIWIDCTSGVPDSAQYLSQYLIKQHVYFLDAPVSGQTIGAKNGVLTVMVGGDKTAFLKAKPFIETFSQLIEYVGESGAGFAVKAVNNTLMATHLWALAEGLLLLKAKKVNIKSALHCINHSSGQSSISTHIMAQKVLTRSFHKTFALNLLQKDIAIAIDLLKNQQLNLALLQHVQQQFQCITPADAIDIDFSAVVQSLEQQYQLELS
ncbi:MULTISPECIES: NAD(P)-dependent oxidoreductase [unclassified Acinetobacter]|uniref:NAD(P)-dependent oxidoreductase n=1 Tax=unclassified Acinetobacter TaxID=196816 RepID=UPI00293417C7|nr:MULTISPECIES: NAD(P)-dependent oxidoreductase [unclassified Acinetobacter]WOE33107.1 NAD(P)-dependent oxidoreductase [Acinetobacter sp. SAAs470]WOE39933.1 NAD(P)-dependent oxidoreductase [Acinetobacter sp. SAAs474]